MIASSHRYTSLIFLYTLADLHGGASRPAGTVSAPWIVSMKASSAEGHLRGRARLKYTTTIYKIVVGSLGLVDLADQSAAAR